MFAPNNVARMIGQLSLRWFNPYGMFEFLIERRLEVETALTLSLRSFGLFNMPNGTINRYCRFMGFA